MTREAAIVRGSGNEPQRLAADALRGFSSARDRFLLAKTHPRKHLRFARSGGRSVR